LSFVFYHFTANSLRDNGLRNKEEIIPSHSDSKKPRLTESSSGRKSREKADKESGAAAETSKTAEKQPKMETDQNQPYEKLTKKSTPAQLSAAATAAVVKNETDTSSTTSLARKKQQGIWDLESPDREGAPERTNRKKRISRENVFEGAAPQFNARQKITMILMPDKDRQAADRLKKSRG
uniref:Shugoshin_C domain-containing protein n=1 Tax=Gongylonema pulchrum TaxID=637853 RepID=A0A183EBM8_9BILA